MLNLLSVKVFLLAFQLCRYLYLHIDNVQRKQWRPNCSLADSRCCMLHKNSHGQSIVTDVRVYIHTALFICVLSLKVLNVVKLVKHLKQIKGHVWTGSKQKKAHQRM